MYKKLLCFVLMIAHKRRNVKTILKITYVNFKNNVCKCHSIYIRYHFLPSLYSFHNLLIKGICICIHFFTKRNHLRFFTSLVFSCNLHNCLNLILCLRKNHPCYTVRTAALPSILPPRWHHLQTLLWRIPDAYR